MRSPAELRRRGEQALHAIALLLTATLLYLLGFQAAGTAGTLIKGEALPALLPALTAAPPRPLHVSVVSVPAPRDRDWLRALSGPGHDVTWSAATPLSSLAVEDEPRVDPAGGRLVHTWSRPGETVRLSDAVGGIDSVTGVTGSLSIELPTVIGQLRIDGRTGHASADSRDSLLPRRVIVLGQAGWESKFAIAALEERGWPVDARLLVAPGVVISQGSASIDTARAAVVIALDSSAAPYARAIDSFVRSGGGLILEPLAAALPVFAGLAPARNGRSRPASALEFGGPFPRRALATVPLQQLRAAAVVVDSQDGMTVAAAMRVAAGRVLQIGFQESWRWRMSGVDGAVAAHGDWWKHLVASVAYRATAHAAIPVIADDPAPLAGWYSALGTPGAASGGIRAGLSPAVRFWLLGAILCALLLEWGSRRSRGAV